MKREKFYERDQLTYEEKQQIALKSDECCCHCGKKGYFGYGATIDHFIPLHKGGSNRSINLIQLCLDCNKEKDDKILSITYVPYLKEPYKKELSDYVDSYVKAFEYIERNRIFAYDEYELLAIPEVLCGHNLKKNKARGIKFKIKYATWEDYPKLCDFFEKYLKRNDSFNNRAAVESNISFWMRFGCIYYIEKNGEISLMAPFTVKHIPDYLSFEDIPYMLNIYMFSYYTTSVWVQVLHKMMTSFPGFVMDEQGISVVPTMINILNNDKILSNYDFNCLMINKKHSQGENGVFCQFANVNSRRTKEEISEKKGLDKTRKFFDNFNNIDRKLSHFFKEEHTYDNVGWMLYDLYTPEEIDQLGLFENNELMAKLNKTLLIDQRGMETLHGQARGNNMEFYKGDFNEFVANLTINEIETNYDVKINNTYELESFVYGHMEEIVNELKTEVDLKIHPREVIYVTGDKNEEGEILLSIHFPNIPYDSVSMDTGNNNEFYDINDSNTYIYRFDNINQMSKFAKVLNLDAKKYSNLACYSVIYRYENSYILLLIMPFSEMEVSKHMEFAKGLCYQPVIKNKRNFKLMLNEHGEILKSYDEMPIYQLINL